MEKPFKVRDKRNRGWFYLDNEYLNGLGKYMGPIGIAVYVSLCRHADNEQKCFPAQELIAEELNIGVRTVQKYIALLRKHNVIFIEREKSSRKWAQNIYWLVDKEEWKYPSKLSHAPHASDVHPHETTISPAPNDNVHTHQLRTKDTNSNNTNIRKTNKDVFGELEQVKLTTDEHSKLVERFGEKNTELLIFELDTYIASSGKKYSSHYATLLNWARRKVQEIKKPAYQSKEYKII